MGYLRPTAIIVSASYGRDNKHWTDIAHAKAIEVFGAHELDQLVSPVVQGVANDERSFFIAWDGSKEGWEPSDRGDMAREEFVAWLRRQAYKDHSSALSWVEVQYGGDDREVITLAHDGELEIGEPVASRRADP